MAAARAARDCLACLVAVVLASDCLTGASGLTLTGDSPWVIAGGGAVIGDDLEPTPYNMALLDVQRDWYKVLGNPPALVQYPLSADIPGPAVYLGTLEACPWLATMFDLSPCKLGAGDEAHCVLVANNSIVATGSTTRGAIYGLYHFAEHVLNVDPWYHFTDHQPEYLGTIEVPDTLRLVVAPPRFYFRGMFTNDEDLLGYSKADPLGESVFDIRTWDMVFETTLRNKANMIIPGTTPNPDEKHLRLAARRGVVVSQSHFEIAGFGALEWLNGDAAPRNTYNWTSHPDLMAHAWRAAIDAQRDRETIFTVGLRGLWDYEYCDRSRSAESCGDLISSAISNQTTWIRASSPQAPIITYLWDEGLDLFKRGFIKVPAGVHVIFTDGGDGYIGGLDDLKYAEGIYYHTMMLNGKSNQLSEMVPPSRIFDQLRQFIANCSKTFYFVDNVSDLFPAPLSASAVLKFAWDPTPYIQNPDPNATQYQFLLDWSTTQFGPAAAKGVAGVYTQYFAIPYVFNGRGDEYIGETLGKVAGPASTDLRKGGITNTTLAGAQQALAELQPSLPACNATFLAASAPALLALIPQRRQQFFKTHVLYQAALHHHGANSIAALVHSIELAAANNTAAAVAQANLAVQELDGLFSAQRMAEGTGQWRGIFMGDRLQYSALQNRRRAVLEYRAVLQNKTQRVADSGRGYYSFYGYQADAIDNYPLFYPNETYKANDYVLIACNATSTDPQSYCVNGPDGGKFRGQRLIGMWSTRCRTHDALLPLAQCAPSIQVRYTLDGSRPTASSPIYTQPFAITKTTSIAAAVEVNATLHQLVHVSNYEAVP